MNFTFNSYAYILLFSGLTTAALALLLNKTGGRTLKWFASLMGASAFWCVTYGLELASTDYAQAVFFARIEYLGIASIPVFWFMFCLSFCNKTEVFISKVNTFLLLLPPIITVALVWTSSSHYLYYKSVEMKFDGPFPMLTNQPGVCYRFFIIYFYCLMGIGLFFLFNKLKNSDRVYYRQNLSVIFAALIPWIANFGYLAGFRILKYIDITPFAFIATSIIIYLSVFYFRLFDLIPVAREKILDMMNEGYLVLDNQFVIVDHNQAMREFIDMPAKSQILGKHISVLFEDYPEFLNNLYNNKEGITEIPVLKDDEEKYYEANLIIYQEEKIDTTHYIIRFYDETNNRKEAFAAKEQTQNLEKLNHLKNRIFSIIAHDLRGPLINLSAVLKLSIENEINSEEFESLAPTLIKDINYTSNILENLLQWSQSQFRDFKPKKDFINLHNLVLREIEQHQRAASRKKITITHQTNPLYAVYADVVMLQTVIRNLIGNAVKFCNEHGNIHLSSSTEDQKWIILSITDDGVGMSKEVLEKLFADEEYTTRGTQDEKGTGLGMIICKEFMQKMGGNILVETELGKGSSFFLWIPTKETDFPV